MIGFGEAVLDAVLQADAVKSRAVLDRAGATGDRRYGAELLAAWQVSPELTATGGIRYVYREPGDGSDARSIPSAVIGGEWRPAAVPTLALKGELESELTDTSHPAGADRGLLPGDREDEVLPAWRMGLGRRGVSRFRRRPRRGRRDEGRAQVPHQRGHERVHRNAQRLGYRLGGGVDGSWKLSDFAFVSNAQIYASLEHFQPYDISTLMGIPFGSHDADHSAQTSLAAGFPASVGRDGRLAVGGELSLKDGGYTAYGQQYWSQRIGDWTWAVENRLAWADTDSQQRLRDHLRMGAALRPNDQSVEGLAVAGVRLDRDAINQIERLNAYWSAGGWWALDGATRIIAPQAGQYQNLSAAGADGQTFMLMGEGGIERDFEVGDELHVRLGLNGTVFYDVLQGDSYAGFGGEIGFVPSENVLLSVGYNWAPIDPSALSDIYASGLYLRLSVKLDDSLWNVFDNAGLTVPAGGGRE